MHYAAYGSNLHPLRLAERISSARLVTTSFLRDWSLCLHKLSQDSSGKCNILLGGDGVYVAIFDMSAEGKRLLDEIEGLHIGYSEVVISLSEVGDCITYVAKESHIDDSLEPYDWYKELVLLGARAHGFPGDYLRRIESIPAHEDPDLLRRVTNWKTVERIKAGNQRYPEK